MSFKPKTIRRSPAQLRAYMRSFNELAKGMRSLRKLIDAELKLSKERKKKVKKVSDEEAELSDLFEK